MEYVFRKQRRATMNFSTIGNLNTQLKTMEMKNLWNLKQENKDYTSKGKTLDEWLKSAEVEAIQEMVDRGDEKLRNICTKMEFGGNLTPEEREYLKAKAPDKYQELVAEEAEQKAYEEALRRCKTQEEVDRLQMGRIHKAVSTLKSVENNPNIPLHKKLEIAMKENRTLQDAMESTAKFIESGAYDRLPSEKDEVKDKEQIALLNTRMEEKVKDNPEISISELDIVGVTEIFNHNDSEFVFKYGRKTKNVTSLSCDELRLFCQEHNLTFENVVLDIQVQSLYEGNVVSCALVRDLIDFTDDEERCLLSKGIWYQYNDDYLKYLRDSIAEIRAEYHPSYDFNSQKHMEFIETFFPDARSDPSNAQKNDSEIRAALKKKYYTERAFNMLMEQDYGFQNFDRDSKSVSGAKVEIMDLYKDGIMYAVKVGNTSAKLCYAVDQSIASLRLYKHKLLNDMPEIHTVAIWLILERATHIEVDGVPDINSLDMLMLKNRLQRCPLYKIGYRVRFRRNRCYRNLYRSRCYPNYPSRHCRCR